LLNHFAKANLNIVREAAMIRVREALQLILKLGVEPHRKGHCLAHSEKKAQRRRTVNKWG
jgi:3-hydroxyisobutyrate dehydrogenase-like beta-hydroxyacid dehydrogenase